MNFKTIRNKIGKYETNAEASAVAAQLQTLIAKYGFDVFKNGELLSKELNNLKLSPTVKAQLILIFSCSTLPDFIHNSKTDLNLVDIDNAIHNVVNSTGLSYKCAIMLIADVFYACGLSFAIEYGPQLVNDSVEYKLHALMPSKMVETEITNAEQLMYAYHKVHNKKSDDKVDESVQAAAEKTVRAILKLCSAGIPKGFYLLGRCYLYGECGTSIDSTRALELMKIATEYGVAEAAAILGDIYYQSEDPLIRDYTLSNHYYTRPGALAIGKERQKSLKDIYMQYSANKTTLVFSGIIFALMIVFVKLFHVGIFSDSSRLVIGIILTVVSGIAYGMAILYNRVKSFNGIRWYISLQYFVWAFYAFILVLA